MKPRFRDVALATFDSATSRSPDGRWLAVPDGQRIRLVDLSPPSKDELIYREAKAKLDPCWRREQAAKAEAEQAWFAVAFHRTWLVKANPKDIYVWSQLQDAASKALVQTKLLPPVTVQLFEERSEPLPKVTMSIRLAFFFHRFLQHRWLRTR